MPKAKQNVHLLAFPIPTKAAPLPSLCLSSMANTGTPKTTTTSAFAVASTRSARKRIKLTYESDQNQQHQQPLIPGLPDEVAEFCLSSVHPSFLYSVCQSWRRLIYSPSFPPFLSLYALLSSSSPSSLPTTDHDQTQFRSSSIDFYSFDPILSKWQILPPPPPEPPLHLLLHHPSFISRNLPIQSVSVSGNLVLLAATTHHFLPALPRPLIFNPLSMSWIFGPPLATPRRWCAAGVSNNDVYVASGIGSQYNIDVARSLEKWDLQNKNCYNKNIDFNGGVWEKKNMLSDGRFSRDAIEAVGYRNKLYMVNVKGGYAKEGIVYDIAKDAWSEMPEGMKSGWRGPAASMDEDVMYMVDQAKGALRRYNPNRDGWDEITESDKLKGAEQISAGGGRVCVVRGDGGIAVVDVVLSPPKIWLVDTPAGFNAVAVHILPRLKQSRFA